VNPILILLLEGLLFILSFGGLSWLRGEAPSSQFAVEGLAVTALCVVVATATDFIIDPILFLASIYLVTMRARWLVDLGNFLLVRGHLNRALSFYRLAMGLKPDSTGRAIALINSGVAQLRQGKAEEAISSLQAALEAKPEGRLSPKYEAACHYNLGLACRRTGKEAEAIRQFNEAIDALPSSIYALQAQAALEKRQRAAREKGGNSPTIDKIR